MSGIGYLNGLELRGATTGPWATGLGRHLSSAQAADVREALNLLLAAIGEADTLDVASTSK